MKHRGEIVERVIRKSGLSLTILAAKLGISRNTLYNRFKEKNLSYDFILTVGSILHYNFALDFPEMLSDTQEPGDVRAELWRLEKKYKSLLEKSNRLLRFLLKKSQDADQYTLYLKIKEFINSSCF